MFHVFVILDCNSLLLTIQFPVTLTHQKCRLRFRSCCHQLSSLTEVTVLVMCCTNVCQRSVAHCIRLCTFVACLKPLDPSHWEVLSTVRVPVHVWQSRAASLRLLALWSLELDRGVWSHTRASSLAIIYTLAVSASSYTRTWSTRSTERTGQRTTRLVELKLDGGRWTCKLVVTLVARTQRVTLVTATITFSNFTCVICCRWMWNRCEQFSKVKTEIEEWTVQK